MNIYDNAKGIYLHIPFCVQKCIYCDFNSTAGCAEGEISRYFDILYSECDIIRTSDLVCGADKSLPDTVFIGGGTPTSVDSRYITELMNHIDFAEGSEVTIESNPGTLTLQKLRDYRACGINRISMGVQSFQDEELRFLGRIHSAQDACDSFNMAREAGFDNINIDLIFGFPGQTMESWQSTLDKAMDLSPDHISFYSLQIEEGTRMYQLFRNGDVDQISDELNREMYHYAVKILKEHGYVHYEISNAAKPGYECRHNLKYWDMTPYIGLGAGAHSYYEGKRFFNPDSIDEYAKAVYQKIETCDITSGIESCENTIEDNITDYLFTGLRRTSGIELADFNARFNTDFYGRYGERIMDFINQGFLEEVSGWLRFTEKGLDITNYILTELM